MNLALKDTRYHLFRFLSSTVGVALILMVVLTIGGIIRGIILDSATITQETGADLWVVQKNWLGPFVEISRFPEDYYHAIQAIHGVAEASPLVMAWDHIEHPMVPTSFDPTRLDHGACAVSDVAGWAYHFWNGACFGLMYVLIRSCASSSLIAILRSRKITSAIFPAFTPVQWNGLRS